MFPFLPWRSITASFTKSFSGSPWAKPSAIFGRTRMDLVVIWPGINPNAANLILHFNNLKDPG